MSIVTTRTLRELTGKPWHQIQYALTLYGPPATDRIGQARVWSSDLLPKLLEAIGRVNHSAQ